MLRNFAIVIFIFMVFIPLEAPGKTWKNQLEPVLKKWNLPSDAYAIRLERLDSGKNLFSHQEKQAFNPASTIKLLTAASALSELGPNHRFQTRLFQTQTQACLKGGGDPSLVSERMWLLVREAIRKGFKEIPGDLWLDTSLFPREKFSRHFQGDRNRAFTAPISSLLVNFNSLTIFVSPTTLGKPASIQLDPHLPWFHIHNRTRTRKKTNRKSVDVSIQETSKGQMSVDTWGSAGLNRGEITLYRNVPSPADYAGHLFIDLFKKAGGTFQGKILQKNCPAHATEVLEFSSVPLSQIVFGMNKFSNNVIAEMLLRAVGKEPTRESGLQALRNWLNASNISAPELKLNNASGLSRKNRISAKSLAAIIRTAANDLRIGPEFLSSLGIAGTDGTLRRRLKDFPQANRIRAKSGRLANVVALAGVVDTPKVGKLVYVFFSRPAQKQAWNAQKMEEDLLKAIIAYNGQ